MTRHFVSVSETTTSSTPHRASVFIVVARRDHSSERAEMGDGEKERRCDPGRKPTRARRRRSSREVRRERDCSRSVWGRRPRVFKAYNDVVSRLPSFQIFMFAIISVAVLVLYGTAKTRGRRR